MRTRRQDLRVTLTGATAPDQYSHIVDVTLPHDPDWHLQAWAKECGKKQSDLVAELDWHKNAAFRIWHGKQPYRRDTVNAVAAWLGIEPFELLMEPSQAIALRRLRDTAHQIAAATPPSSAPAAPKAAR